MNHDNLDAELALVAFGGAEPACVAHYRLWEDAIADGGFLAEWVDDTRLTESWFSWLAMALERMRSEGFHEFLRGISPARAQRMGEFLHAFPVPWIDRAAAEVSQRVADGDGDGKGVACSHAEPLLREGTAQRIRRSFVDAVGGRQLPVGAAALVPLSISVGGDAGVSGALTGPDRGVALTVPSPWLHQVWAAGAAVIDGELALEVSAPDRSALVVRWDETPTQTQTQTRTRTPTLAPMLVRRSLGGVGDGDGSTLA